MVDEDGDGTLDRFEVKKLCSMVEGKQMSEKELNEAMAALDSDSSGKVSFEEFKQYWEENISTGGGLLAGIMERYEAGSLKEVKGQAYHPDRYVDPDEEFRMCCFALFSEIDRSKDLNISLTEMDRWISARGLESQVPSDWKAQFAQYDTNGNGTIDRDECCGLIKAMNMEKLVPSKDEAQIILIKEREKRMRHMKNQNPRVYNHPVWNQEFSFPDLDINVDEVDKFKELFSMVETEYCGYIGHRQFTDLLKLLAVDVSEEVLKKMFDEMDENDDGEITFDEFVPGIVHNISKDQLDKLEHVQLGACGTRRWSRGEVVWAANTGLIICSIGIFLFALFYFDFMLIPLTSAYFFVFLFSPIMNTLMFRPLECGSISICDPMEEDPDDPGEMRYKSEGRREAEGAKASCMDIFTLCILPAGLALLATMFIVFTMFGILGYLVYSEVTVLLADEDFMAKLDAFVEDMYSSMNKSGMRVIRGTCDGRRSCSGSTVDEINGTVSIFSNFFNQVALIFLLTLYIMSEKTMPTLFNPDNKIMMEIETQVMGYLSLKTALSAMTGAVVSIILLFLQVKLAVMFGLLSFVLNYIPNVGSMIAMFLPLPVVIVDDNLAQWQKIGAFVGPGAVQGYVGNALEPILFGKSLNMTPLSILAALVIWSAIWGLMGAIFSVPLLGVQKILMSHTNHPMAKYVIMLIREDATIDEQAEASAPAIKTPLSKKDGGGSGDDSLKGSDKVENPMEDGDD